MPDIRGDLVISEVTTSEGVFVTNLTILARAQYNGTRIQCLSVIIGGPFVESDSATLTIQGICSLPQAVCYSSSYLYSLSVCLFGIHAQRGLLYFVCLSVCLLLIFCTTVYDVVNGMYQ